MTYFESGSKTYSLYDLLNLIVDSLDNYDDEDNIA